MPGSELKSLFAHEGPVGIERVVELAHRHLGLEVVYVSELIDGERIPRAIAGDAASFGFEVGEGVPAEGSFSQLLVTGAIADVIPDIARDPATATLRHTLAFGIGAFIGVPLRYSDSSTYGALCGMSHKPDYTLSKRDVRFMAMLAELIVYDLEEQRKLQRSRADVSKLIESSALEIAYQPIVDLQTGRYLGLESLARFPANLGTPDKALPLAHSVGLGLELEQLAVSMAWPTLSLLKADQFLAINVSPGALMQLAIRGQQRTDLSFDQLVVEITEESVVHSYEELREAISPLRERGLRIAVDDAGAGYASLHHVVELRPDYIKVDRSLVHGLADDHVRRVAMRAFVHLSHDLDGSMVVAEGVERRADLSILQELGVQAAQGYLLGRPSTSAEDVARWTSPDNPGVDLKELLG